MSDNIKNHPSQPLPWGDDPRNWQWRCDTCGHLYPEYHNGCVHCLAIGIKASVVNRMPGSDFTGPMASLHELIEMVCSAHEIAAREGRDTNWQGFKESCRKALAAYNRNGVTPRTYRIVPGSEP